MKIGRFVSSFCSIIEFDQFKYFENKVSSVFRCLSVQQSLRRRLTAPSLHFRYLGLEVVDGTHLRASAANIFGSRDHLERSCLQPATATFSILDVTSSTHTHVSLALPTAQSASTPPHHHLIGSRQAIRLSSQRIAAVTGGRVGR